MFNSQRPNAEDLPSNAQLVKATLVAAVAAGALLVTVVLPSEYAIDPTGIGRALGLTDMGEIKLQLAEEAAADAAVDAGAGPHAAATATAAAAAAAASGVQPGATAPTAAASDMPPETPAPAATASGIPPAAPTPAAAATAAPKQAAATPTVAARSDTTRVTLAAGEAAEVKVTATKDAKIAFEWLVEGGVVNYDTHADAPGIDYHGYGKGRGSAGERGTLVAAFDGKHGWFWRNRSDVPVTIVLKTQGAYSDVKRVG